MPAPAHRAHQSISSSMAAGLASLATLLGWLLGLLMMAQLLLVTLRANPANRWAAVIESWAPRLNLGLFSWAPLPDTMLGFWLGYAIAAVVWVLLGAVLSRALRLIAHRHTPAQEPLP